MERFINRNFIFDPKKNKKLKEERGVNFEDIIVATNQNYLLDIKLHHNPDKYPRQKILVIEVDDYVYLLPFIEEGNFILLKTDYPSRKETATYLHRGDKDDKA